MKKIRPLLGVLLLALALAVLAGCHEKVTAEPTLRVVYIAGNETQTIDAAGRANAVASRHMFGTTDKVIDYDSSLEPPVIAASDFDGTVKLVFSSPETEVKVYRNDYATGASEEVSLDNGLIRVEGGQSYNFSVTGTWTVGNSTYEMEFAFDLAYQTPQEQAVPSESPAAEEAPQPSASDEAPSVQSASPSEPEPSDVGRAAGVYTQPPALTVTYNGDSIQPQMGTTSWNYAAGNGSVSGFEADSSHPMQWENMKTVTRIYGDNTLSFSFEVEPSWVTVTVWNDKYMDSDPGDYDVWYAQLKNMVQKVQLDNGTMTLGTGYNTGYVVAVQAGWQHGQAGDDDYWGGSTVYAFQVTETNY